MESTKYQTFFDIGIDEINDKPFSKLIYVNYTNKKKKRVINNELIRRYFNKDNLSKDELIRVKKILDGSIYTDRRNQYNHCKLCSDDFERIPLTYYSSKYKYWELCIPTFPYFPCGLMIYLKDRKKLHIENVQDLPNDYIMELVDIQDDLLNFLQNGFLGKDLVGVNILFNQISKSELCIHGHVELMIKDIDEKKMGCNYVLERPYDRFTENINKKIPNCGALLKIPEGIKFDYSSMKIDDLKLYIKSYEDIINYYFTRGKKLQNSFVYIENEEDMLLKSNMIPAVVNFIYFTMYRNKYMISLVPSITSEFIPLNETNDNPINLYSLIINRNYSNSNNIFMKNFSPLVRPSIKVCEEGQINEHVKTLEKNIFMELGK